MLQKLRATSPSSHNCLFRLLFHYHAPPTSIVLRDTTTLWPYQVLTNSDFNHQLKKKHSFIRLCSYNWNFSAHSFGHLLQPVFYPEQTTRIMHVWRVFLSRRCRLFHNTTRHWGQRDSNRRPPATSDNFALKNGADASDNNYNYKTTICFHWESLRHLGQSITNCFFIKYNQT